MLDWDNQGRSEQIQISDAATGTVLDTETISSFSGGVYLDWTVSGHVRDHDHTTGGPNAVLSGLFLDPARGVRRPSSSRTRRRRGTGSAPTAPGLRHRRRPDQPPLLRHRHARRPVDLHLGDHLDRPPRPPDAGGSDRIAAVWYSPPSPSTST